MRRGYGLGMRAVFTDELDSVHADLATICGLVKVSVRDATTALVEGNAALAEQVISADERVDRARDQLEEKAFGLLSLQAPVAGDLRLVVAALRIVSDLERMGDLSVHVAKIARLRVPQTAVPPGMVSTIGRMAEIAEDMVGQLQTIIARRDVAAIAELKVDEEEMDQLRRSLFTAMIGDVWPYGVEAAVDIALLGRYYERIADHAVSVANRIVFVVTGEVALQR